MRTVSIFMNNRNQAIRIPRDMEFHGVSELEITRQGDVLILRPARPSWGSLRDIPAADADFLTDRDAIIEEGHFLDTLDAPSDAGPSAQPAALPRAPANPPDESK